MNTKKSIMYEKNIKLLATCFISLDDSRRIFISESLFRSASKTDLFNIVDKKSIARTIKEK